MMNRIFKMITVGSAVALVCGAMVFAEPNRDVCQKVCNPGISAPHHGVKPNEFRHTPEFNHNPGFNHSHDFNHNSAPKPEGFKSRDFKSGDFKPYDFNRKPEFNHKHDFNRGHDFNHKPDFNRNNGFNRGHNPDFKSDDFNSKEFKPNAFDRKPGFRHRPDFATAPASTEATTTTENAAEQTVK